MKQWLVGSGAVYRLGCVGLYNVLLLPSAVLLALASNLSKR